MHGGAQGSGAPNGERNGHYRHGFYTAEAIAERQALRALIRELGGSRPVQCSPAALAHDPSRRVGLSGGGTRLGWPQTPVREVPAIDRFDSEQFRPGPRTCRLLCGRLSVRQTTARGGRLLVL
jgi:hypothetical protein